MDLKRFLGMVNYYHHFVSHIATLLERWIDSLKDEKRNLREVKCDLNAEGYFGQVKEVMNNATLLYHPSQNAEFALTADYIKLAMRWVL